jgi:hypothetical protein
MGSIRIQWSVRGGLESRAQKSVGGVKKEGGNLLRGMPADKKEFNRSCGVLQAIDRVRDSYIVADARSMNIAPLRFGIGAQWGVSNAFVTAW